MDTSYNTFDWERDCRERRKAEERRYAALDRYMAFFRRKGWTEFPNSGQGMYVVAMFLSPDGTRVAKLADLQTRDGWPLFAQWACTTTSPHLPKFYTARTLRGEWFLGIMERLQPLPIGDFRDLDFPDSSDHLDDDMRAKLRDADLLARATIRHWENPDSLMGKALLLRIASKTMRAFGRALIKQFNGQAADLHCGNVMLRGDTLVVIDPYAHRPE